jgi:hypothetical protein
MVFAMRSLYCPGIRESHAADSWLRFRDVISFVTMLWKLAAPKVVRVSRSCTQRSYLIASSGRNVALSSFASQGHRAVPPIRFVEIIGSYAPLK